MAEMTRGVANKPAYEAVSTAPVVSADAVLRGKPCDLREEYTVPAAGRKTECSSQRILSRFAEHIAPKSEHGRTCGHSQPEADQNRSCGIDAHRKKSPSEPPQQTSGLRTGKCRTGFEMAEPEFAYTERDKIGVERELHSAEGHRSRGKSCDATVGAYQRQSRTHAELRGRLRHAFISGRSHSNATIPQMAQAATAA